MCKKSKHELFDSDGIKRFSLTFEVDGLRELEALHEELINKGVKAGDIEDRGHPGRNFLFSDPDGNLFDVWSELSPSFKKRQLTNKVAEQAESGPALSI
ncbi:hypothetical protein NCCP133_15900 [Cytobacillus sp. NCCP-133]|nr:hypothetical protein NCCP133_15900 [Cytobacillus sp. NCCP-133]